MAGLQLIGFGKKQVEESVEKLIGEALNIKDALSFKGAIDCSTNPKYPAGNAGDLWFVSVAGKVGGVAGATVELGDILVCIKDASPAGNQAEVAANWAISQANLTTGSAGEVGKVLKADDPSVKALASAPAGAPGLYRLVPGKSGLVWVDSSGYIPLKAYGAKWDGATDDTVPLEEALAISIANNFIPIQLPAGTGVIDGTPTIPKNLAKQVVIRGMGELVTTIKLKTALQFLKFENTTKAKGDVVGNVDLSDFTVDGNNLQVEVKVATPVIIGNTTTTQEQIDVKNIKLRRIRTINVPTLEESENARRSISIQVYHSEPGLPKNVIENIDIADCNLTGQYGVWVAGIKAGSPLPLNIYLAHIRIRDVKYVGPNVPNAFGSSSGVQIGQFGWSDGKGIIVENVYSENAADVAFEFDVPCTVINPTAVNQFNSGVLLNTFNPTTSAEPVVAKFTAKGEVGATTIEVSSVAGFSVGDQIVIYGSEVKTCAVRTIKAIGSGTIEFTEALATERASGTWISKVDVDGGKMIVRGLKTFRTVKTSGGCRGLAIQNIENAIPAPAMEIDGWDMTHNFKGIASTVAGEVLRAQFGTATSKSGNPRSLRIRRLRAKLTNVELSGSSNQVFVPIRMEMNGEVFPVEIQGDIEVSGAGSTGTGQMTNTSLCRIRGNAEIDIDLRNKGVLGSTLGQSIRFLNLNDESNVGSISGRIRQRIYPSSISSGGGSLIGIRLGKGCGFASASTRTKTTAIAAAGATSIEVENVSEFSAGMAIVLDAESTTKSEVFSIEKIEGSKIFLVQVLGVGTAAEHASGVVVARLNSLVIEDSDWSGLGVNGTSITIEDTKVGSRLMLRGSVQPKPTGSSAVTIPASGKIQQILQGGQSGALQIKGGTVTKVEMSSNGSSFFQVASATNVGIHVSPGDFFKLTWSVEPEAINFIPDRL